MDNTPIEFCHLSTPLGTLRIEATDAGVCAIRFLDRQPAERRRAPRGHTEVEEHLRATRAQLSEYFRRRRKEFELELDLRGTDFDVEVWQLLLEIPFGRTRSYGQIARELGGIERARAVGGACSRNPVSVVVPCHRVIGSDHDLTGYGGGLPRKEKLLRLEGASFAAPQLGLFDS